MAPRLPANVKCLDKAESSPANTLPKGRKGNTVTRPWIPTLRFKPLASPVTWEILPFVVEGDSRRLVMTENRTQCQGPGALNTQPRAWTGVNGISAPNQHQTQSAHVATSEE